jgi:hypothetical protein
MKHVHVYIHRTKDAIAKSLKIPGFVSFEIVPDDKGEINFYGVANVALKPYTFYLKAKSVRIISYRHETSNSIALNSKLDKLMDVAREYVARWLAEQGY